jgi:hypothetical protein
MFFEDQVNSLAEAGYFTVDLSQVEISVPEIYEKGFVIVDNKLSWQRAKRGFAFECREKAEKYNLEDTYKYFRLVASKGYPGTDFPKGHIVYHLTDALRLNGFNVPGDTFLCEWRSATEGVALEIREIYDRYWMEHCLGFCCQNLCWAM